MTSNNDILKEYNKNHFMYNDKLVSKEEVPILTLMVTTYNQEKIIVDTLNSLINQKTKYKYKILISDDSSTDNTMSILKEYEQKNEFIKVIEVRNKKKVGKNRNNLLANLETNYGCFIDGDDPQNDMYVDTIIKQIFDKKIYKISTMQQIWNKKTESYNVEKLYGPVTYIFSKEIAKKIKFNEDLTIGEDLMLAIEYYDLLTNVDVEIINVIYRANRKNEEASLTIKTDMKERYKQEVELYEKIKKYRGKFTKTDELINMKAIDIIIYQFILKYKLNKEKIYYKDQTYIYQITYILILISTKISFEYPLRLVLKKYVKSRI